MHYLHKVLVYIPDIVADGDDRESLISAVRTHAESVTESFYDQAFDWRETDTAGRWAHIYPENVLLAGEDPNRFLQELERASDQQKQELDFHMQQLKGSVGTDLATIAEGIWKCRDIFDTEEPDKFGGLTAYNLHCISAYLYGEYRCDSYFYNTNRYTARLYKTDVEAVKKSPDDWALVIFDYHS